VEKQLSDQGEKEGTSVAKSEFFKGTQYLKADERGITHKFLF